MKQKIKRNITRIKDFIRDDIWELELEELSKARARFIKYMKVIIITINLGVFNLLPIPALDGGRLLFLLIEAITRRPVNPKVEGYIHLAGLMLLLGMMLLVTCKDIAGFFV